jgi:hypothetical protein
MIYQSVRSQCCEAPVRMGHKVTKSGRAIIWICVSCKKRDVNLLEYKNGKVIRPRDFAQEIPEEEDNNEDI